MNDPLPIDPGYVPYPLCDRCQHTWHGLTCTSAMVSKLHVTHCTCPGIVQRIQDGREAA